MQSYLFFLRLNIRTFNVLLHIFQEELAELLNKHDNVTDRNPQSSVPQTTTKMERILPALRLYTLWLRKNVAVVACSVDSALGILQQKFWISFAQCLSLTAEVFPAETLSEVSRMFEEDVDTIGFKPLQCDQNKDVWVEAKLGQHETFESGRDMSREMLARVRDLLVTGLKLAFDEVSPPYAIPRVALTSASESPLRSIRIATASCTSLPCLALLTTIRLALTCEPLQLNTNTEKTLA